MNASEPGARAKKILVVDDDQVILKVLSIALNLHGYEVAVATDGPGAVTAVGRERPDLIVLDINFPPDAANVGGALRDGFFIVEWLRRMGKGGGIPVIIISVDDSAENRKRTLDAGAVAFFPKPIDNQALLAAIRTALGEQTAAETPGPA
jgi:CheY-like chemotaxis protein